MTTGYTMYRDLEQIAPHVWIYPYDDSVGVTRPNVGIIRADDKTILVDAGNSPRHARLVLAELANPLFGPVDALVYTHHHWDHVFGAMEYNARRIIAHRRTAELLQPLVTQVWSSAELREEIYENPRLELRNTAIERAIDDWRTFRVVAPDVTFSSRLRLYYDAATLDMQHVGGQHAEDSIIVRIPESKVMFLGDCFYPPTFHEATATNSGKLNVELLESLIDAAYDIYVDGHSQPHTYDDMLDLIAAEKAQQET